MQNLVPIFRNAARSLGNWVERFSRQRVVVVSEPYWDGQTWSYIVGDTKNYEPKRFPTAEAAQEDQKLFLMALNLGPPIIFFRLITLEVTQTQAVTSEATYRALVASCLKKEVLT